MKTNLLFLFLIGYTALSFGQSNGKQDFERKLYLELNGRTSFYEVNERYQLLEDTIFHTNTGFKIYPEYDTKEIDGTDYIIIKYPNFNNGIQSTRENQKIVKAEMKEEPVHKELKNINGKILAIKKSEYDLINKTDYYSVNFKYIRNYNFSFGVLTVPFKLRPSLDSISSNITTDITLGPYLGITKRLAPRKRFYMTLPLNLGLTYININDNNTSSLPDDNNVNVVPGISWSTGLIFQLEDFNIGFVLGQDFASGIGNDWIYNKEPWYSFAIGYNFLKDK